MIHKIIHGVYIKTILQDLLALAEGGDAKKTKETIFNSAPADTEVVSSSDVASDTSKEDTKQNSKSDLPIIILVVLVVGGVYYYLKVYKPKKAAEMDLADAMDIDEFETEEDGSEEDEIIFEESEAKERLLRKITNEAMDIENEKSINENDMPSIDVADQEFLNMSLEDFEREMDEVVDMEMVPEGTRLLAMSLIMERLTDIIQQLNWMTKKVALHLKRLYGGFAWMQIK